MFSLRGQNKCKQEWSVCVCVSVGTKKLSDFNPKSEVNFSITIQKLVTITISIYVYFLSQCMFIHLKI